MQKMTTRTKKAILHQWISLRPCHFESRSPHRMRRCGSSYQSRRKRSPCRVCYNCRRKMAAGGPICPADTTRWVPGVGSHRSTFLLPREPSRPSSSGEARPCQASLPPCQQVKHPHRRRRSSRHWTMRRKGTDTWRSARRRPWLGCKRMTGGVRHIPRDRTTLRHGTLRSRPLREEWTEIPRRQEAKLRLSTIPTTISTNGTCSSPGRPRWGAEDPCHHDSRRRQGRHSPSLSQTLTASSDQPAGKAGFLCGKHLRRRRRPPRGTGSSDGVLHRTPRDCCTVRLSTKRLRRCIGHPLPPLEVLEVYRRRGPRTGGRRLRRCRLARSGGACACPSTHRAATVAASRWSLACGRRDWTGQGCGRDALVPATIDTLGRLG